jgi:Leu/Phe-tRNA-protein transferase
MTAWRFPSVAILPQTLRVLLVVGGLFGVAMGNVLTIDTLVGLPDSKQHRPTSKAALCHLVLRGHEQGITLIDGEVQHQRNHPAARLGESRMNFADFREYLFQNSGTRNDFIRSNRGAVWR